MSDSSAQDTAALSNREDHGAAPAGSDLPAGSPTKLGRFELRAMLGEGAFGRVYRGFDPELRRDVAIKVPHAGALNEEFRERFIREARAVATVHHPNVCPVYEVGSEGEVPYIVMRFVAGTTLAAIVDGLKTPMPPRNALMIVRKLALGMAAAHAQGVTHRDLKPANVLYDTANREVLITDFGLARVGGEANLTAKDSFLGTPAYTSPEQANRQIDDVGPLSDLYSIGVILYEMLTGDVPFNGSVMEVAIAHCITPPKPPSHVRPGIDPRLDEIVLKAMAKKPVERFRSAREFADVITEYLRGGDHAAGHLSSSGDIPTVALSGGREPEAAIETVAEKRSNQTTTPAFEVVPTPPKPKSAVTPPKPKSKPVVELDEDEEEPEKHEAKDAKRSANKKSAKQSKGGKKKHKHEKEGVGAALLRNWIPVLGAVLSLVALVLVVVLLARSKSEPATAQKPPADTTDTPPPKNQAVVAEPKVEPKIQAKQPSPVADPTAIEALRLKLLGEWKVTSGISPALLQRLDGQKRFFAFVFRADGSAQMLIDATEPNERIELRKDPKMDAKMRFRVVSATQIEFENMPASFQGVVLPRNVRWTADIKGTALTLTSNDTSIKLNRDSK
jgi:serine/threonine protein kinase